MPVLKLVDIATLNFEHNIKRNFSAEDAVEDYIEINGLHEDVENGFDNGYMILTSDQLRSMFLPVLEQILQLIRGQIEEAANN
ncbi:hypothetical protein M432DRAFT_638093 [Thermoascus aurantiacus ATCC 26904]